MYDPDEIRRRLMAIDGVEAVEIRQVVEVTSTVRFKSRRIQRAVYDAENAIYEDHPGVLFDFGVVYAQSAKRWDSNA